MVAARRVTSTFSTKLLVKRRLVITSVRVRLLKVCVVRHKTGMLNIALLDEKQRSSSTPTTKTRTGRSYPRPSTRPRIFWKGRARRPGWCRPRPRRTRRSCGTRGCGCGAAARRRRARHRQGSRGHKKLGGPGALKAVGARGSARSVLWTRGAAAKGVVEDEVRKKRDWAAQQARAALLERLEKALPDVDEKPQWVAACLQGEVTLIGWNSC